MAGLLTGLLLLRQGRDVHIFERNGAELASRGAGITPHAALFAAFEHAGVDISTALGVTSAGRILYRKNGEVSASSESQQLFTSWGKLYRFLRSEFPDERYHNGHELCDIKSHEERVDLRFSNGKHASFGWLIGADGSRSTVRNAVAPATSIDYAGYVAWRGLVVESLLPSSYRGELARGMSFFLPPHEHMLGYTVAGPDDTLVCGERWYNWVWYRPVASGAPYDEMFSDEAGRLYRDGIAPQRIRESVIRTLQRDASSLLPPQFSAVVANTPRPFLQPIIELASAQLVRGRCLLLGDAAFTARPHIGFGVSKAAEDATQLAQVFSKDVSEFHAALENWEQSRLSIGRAVLKRSADLGCYIGATTSDDAERRRHAYFRSPKVILNGIAAPEPYEFLELES